jgi:hypothetical protein
MTDADKKENAALAKRPPVANIALSQSGALVPTNLAEAIEYAKMIAHSGMVPKQYDGNVGAVLVAVQMGAEIGLPPLAAIQNIAVINGRPSLWGDAVLAVITSQPDCIDVQETAGDGFAKCVVRRRGRTPVECTFTVADAKTAGLWGKAGPWTQYPKRMLQMRARGFACRDAYPDRLRGIKIAEEVRDYDVIDGEFAEAPATLEAGDHSFGFKPKAQPETKPQETPAPVETKKGQKVKFDPKTGVVDEPAHDPHEFDHIGPPPMNEREPGDD